MSLLIVTATLYEVLHYLFPLISTFVWDGNLNVCTLYGIFTFLQINYINALKRELLVHNILIKIALNSNNEFECQGVDGNKCSFM